MIITPEYATGSRIKGLSEQRPRANPVTYSWAPEKKQKPPPASRGWNLAALPLPNMWCDGRWSVLGDRWEQDGFSFKIPEKNLYVTPKLESFKEWWRLDLDQIFRFDSDSTEYLLANILTGVGHLAILREKLCNLFLCCYFFVSMNRCKGSKYPNSEGFCYVFYIWELSSKSKFSTVGCAFVLP